jgi:hypothetical protein
VFRLRVSLATLVLVHCLAAAARASNIPSVSASTVPSRVELCPAGDLVFAPVFRLASGTPIYDGTAELDLCSASGWVLAPTGQPPNITFVQPCMPTVSTDIQGKAPFALKAGGTVRDASIRLTCNSVFLGTLGLSSPDQNGDLTVDARDLGLLVGKVFAAPGDLTGDLDGNGHVDAADLAVLIHHLGPHS